MAKHYWKENEFVRAEEELSAMPKSPWRRVAVGSPAVEREVRPRPTWDLRVVMRVGAVGARALQGHYCGVCGHTAGPATEAKRAGVGPRALH
jgi:hypothetical protein